MVSADRRIQDVGVTHLAVAERETARQNVCLCNVGRARQPGGGLASRLEIDVSAMAVPSV